MDEATKAAILSAVRTVLIGTGAILTAHGVADNATVNEIIGGLMVIIPAIWGILDKIIAERKTKARETIAVQAGVATSISQAAAPDIGPALAQQIVKTYAATQEGSSP